MSTPGTTTPSPDVPAQPVVPSESAGTQTAAGSPSEQPQAAVAVPPSAPTAGETNVPPAEPETAVDPTVTVSEPEPSTPAEPGSATSDATASQSGNEPELQPVDADGNPVPVPTDPGDPNAPNPAAPAEPAETLPPESPAAQPGLTARPAGVGVDGAVYRGRDDNDAVTDRFCRVVSGEYTGRYGVYLSTASLGADGWPETIVVRTRDAEDENLVVNYSDCRPSVPGKR